MAAAALLILSGCQKPGFGKGAVRFAAAAPALQPEQATKAEWGADIGTDLSGVQRIVWQNSDKILIKSDFAKTEGGADSFTYSVTNVDGTEGYENARSTRYSYGKLSPSGEGGLLWDEEKKKTEHHFRATCPALSIDDNGRFSATIPDDGLVMTSYATPTENEAGKTVTFYFYPAFTTVRIQLGNGTGKAVTLNSCTISSRSGDPALTGKFTATIGTDGVVSNASETGGTARTRTNSLGVNLGNGQSMDSFTEFLLMPLERSGLELSVTYTAGAEQITKSLTIDKTFEAGKQYRLTGLMLPEEIKLIDFEVISIFI